MEVMISIPDELRVTAEAHATATLEDGSWELIEGAIAFKDDETAKQFGETFIVD